MDTQKLTKLMMLTTSDQDGEALSAIRMANALLKRAGKNWQEILEPEPSLKPENRPEANSGSGNPFVDALRESARRRAARAAGFGDGDPFRDRGNFQSEEPSKTEEELLAVSWANKIGMGIHLRFGMAYAATKGHEINDFVLGLQRTFARNGKLTPKQWAAFKRICEVHNVV